MALRLVLAASAAASVSGCSDASRFASDPFADPFGTSASSAAQRPPRAVDRTTTGSISGQTNVSAAQSQKLAPPATTAAAPRPIAVAQAPTPVGAYNHWSTQGGTPVTMAQGETPAILANRYGVPTDALVKVNGYGSASAVPAGARLVIPVYRANAAAQNAPEATPKQEAKPAPAKTAVKEKDEESPAPRKHAVKIEALKPANVKAAAKDDDKGANPSRKAQAHAAAAAPAKPQKAVKSAAADDDAKAVKKAKPAMPQKPAKAAAADGSDDEGKPTAKPKAQAPAHDRRAEAPREPKVAQVSPRPAPPATPPAERRVANNDRPAPQTPAAPAPAPQPEPKRAEAAPAQQPQVAEEEGKTASGGHPEFRWPAKGRILQRFADGGNDGINIAVPEGTPVKAAEAGVVAYAGNGLKGYGNLVLVRHPNGFVSAYAHNGEIDVKPGDQVTRGQVIAKSGQSGDVATPQLHFELRKGKTPVDPKDYLAAL